MASGTVVVVPSNAQNIIQTAPGLPGVALQASGATPYPQFGVQQLGISTSAPQQVPQKGPMERFLSAEAKVLGAVQIMIGLVHIGFGAVSLCLIPSSYFILPGTGGYPFWGGIFFISSGSLCVAAVNHPNCGLVKSSVAMNVISAIMALIGIVLYLCELIVNNYHSRYIHQYNNMIGQKLDKENRSSCILFDEGKQYILDWLNLDHVAALNHILLMPVFANFPMSLLNRISVMASPVCCSCSACWNFASLFHLHTLGARQLTVVMTSQPYILCLTKPSEMEQSELNQILLLHHQPTIMRLPNLHKTRTPGRKCETCCHKGFRRSNGFHCGEKCTCSKLPCFPPPTNLITF